MRKHCSDCDEPLDRGEEDRHGHRCDICADTWHERLNRWYYDAQPDADLDALLLAVPDTAVSQ